MILEDDGDTYRLSTGKTFYANNGIIGLSFDDVTPDEDGEYSFGLAEGYDGGISVEKFSDAEILEIAEGMIELWSKYKQNLIMGRR